MNQIKRYVLCWSLVGFSDKHRGDVCKVQMRGTCYAIWPPLASRLYFHPARVADVPLMPCLLQMCLFSFFRPHHHRQTTDNKVGQCGCIPSGFYLVCCWCYINSLASEAMKIQSLSLLALLSLLLRARKGFYTVHLSVFLFRNALT